MRRLIITLFLVAAMCGFFVAPAQADLSSPTAVSRSAPYTETVLARGLDTSRRPTAAGYRSIAAGGYSFVGRYLEISPATGAPTWGGKTGYLTTAELLRARAAGVAIFLIYEWCDGRRHLPNSFAAGARDARIALAALARLGLPADTPVYYSLDQAPGRCNIAQVLEYFQGINSIVEPESVGCYGSKKQLLALGGLITYRWHATWIEGNNVSPAGWGATMYQKTWVVRRGGVWCDQNWAYAADIGAVR